MVSIRCNREHDGALLGRTIVRSTGSMFTAWVTEHFWWAAAGDACGAFAAFAAFMEWRKPHWSHA